MNKQLHPRYRHEFHCEIHSSLAQTITTPTLHQPLLSLKYNLTFWKSNRKKKRIDGDQFSCKNKPFRNSSSLKYQVNKFMYFSLLQATQYFPKTTTRSRMFVRNFPFDPSLFSVTLNTPRSKHQLRGNFNKLSLDHRQVDSKKRHLFINTFSGNAQIIRPDR